MVMLIEVRKKLASWIVPKTSNTLLVTDVRSLQSHPAQKSDVHNMFAPTIDLIPFMVQYAMNHWVYTAVNKIASVAASAEFMITSRPDGMERNHEHGLLDLIGKYGSPNDDQDSFEFLEKHFINYTIAGNSFWLWQNKFGGSPNEVHLLEPERMRIVPGVNRTVARYEYWNQGRITKYSPNEITHFRTANPFNRYYGLSALMVLYLVLLGDNEMLKWNNDFFDHELGIPSGIIVVPSDTSEKAIETFRAEFTARHGEARRVAFIRAEAGKAAWLDAGLKHKDYDFEKGRTLNRRSVYEALDLPLGIMSENSTEANALVAERLLAKSVRIRHTRTMSKLNVDGLNFWSQPLKWQAEFEDIVRKSADWSREKDRVLVDMKTLSLDEMRMREHKLPPLADGVVPVAQMKSETLKSSET